MVYTFFEGFYAQDSVVMKSVFHETPIIQTPGKGTNGDTELRNETLEKVLKGIVFIPLKTNFKEVLHDYMIKIDGDMANT